MTSHLSMLFKKSLLVSAIGVALVGCGGGNGLSNSGVTPEDDCETLGTCPPPDCETLGNCPEKPCEELGNCPPPPTGIEVRDFGGRNGKIVLDANHDSFAVGVDGTLYVYNAAVGAPDPDSDLIPADRLARVSKITVANDNAILFGDEQVGSVAPDQTDGGEQFYVLSYEAGNDQGYLDVDYNKHYGGFAAGDKTDARITQIRAVALQNSFQGFGGATLWEAEDGDVVLGQNIQSLAAEVDALNLSFVAPTSENYHFVLREFDSPYTDLDVRLIDTVTGRILASSYGTLKGELISFPLTAGATYGVNITRHEGSDDVSFLLSIKASPDTDETDSVELPTLTAGGSYTLRGTVHPITRFEFCSRFPTTGWLDASSDSSSDASGDSLFLALFDASGDASDDASGDGTDDATSDPAVGLRKDTDKFWFGSTNTSFFTDYAFKAISEGGDFMTNTVLTYLSSGKSYKSKFLFLDGKPVKTYSKDNLLKGKLTYDLQFDEYERAANGGYQEDTIEYEMVIERE